MVTKRIGLAGLGRMGKRYLQHVEPSVFLRKHGFLGDGWGLTTEEIWMSNNDEDIFFDNCDLVIIATPSPTHCDLVCAALEAGKACLVEKPMVTTREELERVREVWTRTGTPLLVDHTHLWNDNFGCMRLGIQNLRRVGYSTQLIHVLLFNRGARGDFLEWSPHAYAMQLAVEAERLDLDLGPHGRRERSVLVEMTGPKEAYSHVLNLDASCSPTPLARVVDDFVNLRQDYRWGRFGFDVMELVLEGMEKTTS